eukprot:508585-Rhodomonas_salina.1
MAVTWSGTVQCWPEHTLSTFGLILHPHPPPCASEVSRVAASGLAQESDMFRFCGLFRYCGQWFSDGGAGRVEGGVSIVTLTHSGHAGARDVSDPSYSTNLANLFGRKSPNLKFYLIHSNCLPTNCALAVSTTLISGLVQPFPHAPAHVNQARENV